MPLVYTLCKYVLVYGPHKPRLGERERESRQRYKTTMVWLLLLVVGGVDKRHMA